MTYERSWVQLAVYFTLIGLLTVILIACVGWQAFAVTEASSPWRLIAVGFVAILGLGNCAIWFWGLAWTVYRRRGFRCSVNERLVECHCPVPWMGQSFSLAMEKVESIRYVFDSGGGYRCVLTMTDGNEYSLTYWYGNPVHRLVGEIRRLRPEIRHAV